MADTSILGNLIQSPDSLKQWDSRVQERAFLFLMRVILRGFHRLFSLPLAPAVMLVSKYSQMIMMTLRSKTEKPLVRYILTMTFLSLLT